MSPRSVESNPCPTDSIAAVFNNTWEPPAGTHYQWRVIKKTQKQIRGGNNVEGNPAAKHGSDVGDSTDDERRDISHPEANATTSRYVDSVYPTFCGIVDSTISKRWDEMYVSAPEALERHEALIRRDVPGRTKVLSKLNCIQNQGIDAESLKTLFLSLPRQSIKNMKKPKAELSEDEEPPSAYVDIEVPPRSACIGGTPSLTYAYIHQRVPYSACSSEPQNTPEFNTASKDGHIHIPTILLTPTEEHVPEHASTHKINIHMSSDACGPVNMNFPHPVHLFNCRFTSTILNPMSIKLNTMWWWDKAAWMQRLVSVAARLVVAHPKRQNVRPKGSAKRFTKTGRPKKRQSNNAV